MSLVKFNTGNKHNDPVHGFTDIFESFLNDSFISDRMISRVPAVNIMENEDNYEIDMAAPGLKKDDFKISLDKNLLTISVEQKSQTTENNKQWNKREFNYNSFARSFALPDSVDDGKIEAEYNNGLLRIYVAKMEEAKTVSRRIDIK